MSPVLAICLGRLSSRLEILKAIEPLVISRHRRMISGLIKRLNKIPSQDRLQWIFERRSKTSRAVEDLLELSM